MGSFARTAAAVAVALVAAQATAEAQARPRMDRSKLTAEQIAERPASNAYDLIKSLRPNWFSVRGSSTLQSRDAADPYSGRSVTVPAQPEIAIYVDEIRFGSQDDLKTMSTTGIESMERLDAVTATQRFGTNHEHGAILIRRKTR